MLDPSTCQGDLPGKKSQLDLTVGVGIPAVGRKVIPWLWCHTEASKITLLVARVWLMQWVKEWVWEFPTLQRERKVKASSRLKGISPNSARNTQRRGHAHLPIEESTRMQHSNIQGKITWTTLMDQSETSVTVDITRFRERYVWCPAEQSTQTMTALTTYATY